MVNLKMQVTKKYKEEISIVRISDDYAVWDL